MFHKNLRFKMTHIVFIFFFLNIILFLETLKREFINFLNWQKINSIASNKNYGAVCPHLIDGTCKNNCNTDADCQQKNEILDDLKIFLKCCYNGCGRECVLTPITLFSYSSSEIKKNSINLVSSIDSSMHNIAQTSSFLPIKPIEKEVLG